MIFVDSNVFMYAAGSAHPHKAASAGLLKRIAAGEIDATTSTEVFQEILHRYRAIGRWEDGRQVYRLARRIIPAVEPVTVAVLDASFRLLERYPSLMARDGLHAAACQLLGSVRMCSYDADYDAIAGLQRVTPDEIMARR